MQIWVYGASSEQVQDIIEVGVGPADTVVDTSVHAETGSTFPQGGLTQAMSAAIRGKIDLLLIPSFELLGNKVRAAQTIELFQSYGVSIKSISS